MISNIDRQRLKVLVCEALLFEGVDLPPPTTITIPPGIHQTIAKDTDATRKLTGSPIAQNADFSSVNWSPSPSFLEYVKRNENAEAKGFNRGTGKWYPFNGPARGEIDIGYGHKLSSTDLRTARNGLTTNEVNRLLVSDIMKAKALVDAQLKNAGIRSTTLSAHQIEMLVDFAYNGVLSKFPKFMTAVINNDVVGMKREYKRYYNGGTELAKRNAEFYGRYLRKL